MSLLLALTTSHALFSHGNAALYMMVHRAWKDIQSFMDTRLPALLQQPLLTSSRAQPANGTNALAQAASALKTTLQPLETENLEHTAAAEALLSVVMAVPKDSVLRLLAVRSGSSGSCCISPAATKSATEAVTQATESFQAAAEAASVNPAAAEAVAEAAPTSPATKAVSVVPAAAGAVAETAGTSTAAKEAACISPAARDLFLNELHSTALFQVVRHCLDQAQQRLAVGQPVSCQQSQDASMQKMQTAGDMLLQCQAEHAKALVPDVSHQAIPAYDDRGPHFASAAAGATSLAVASVEAPNSSTVGRDADVTEGLGQSDAKIADDNHKQRVCQQELDPAHTESCQVQQNLSDTAAHASCCSQTFSPGSSLDQNPDCSTHCSIALPAEQTTATKSLLNADDTSPPLAEMICMLLLLVPRTVWRHACDEVRSTATGYIRVMHGSVNKCLTPAAAMHYLAVVCSAMLSSQNWFWAVKLCVTCWLDWNPDRPQCMQLSTYGHRPKLP